MSPNKTLGDFTDTDGDSESRKTQDESNQGPRRIQSALQELDQNAEFSTTSCPWCLAPDWKFEDVREDRAKCGGCEATIPLNADWYQNGDKIVV